MSKAKILIVDDEDAIRFAIRDFLELHGCQVDEAADCAQAQAKHRGDVFDLVILDYALPDGNALELLPKFKAIDASVPVILLTAFGSIELAVKAIQLGADQFLVKPLNLPSLLHVVEQVLEHHRNRRKQLAQETGEAPHRAVDPFNGLSPALQKLKEQALRAAAKESPILIQGETGTGKSELARWLHRHSSRSREAMLEINCGGFTKEFLETELFGHEKGAFTGAIASKVGLLEAAHRGTIFLDEVGDMDPMIQPKLLKALEEKRFRRLGEVQDRKVDFRLITATHQDLDQLVAEHRFRADLYYRVSAMPLLVPPLRERIEDIPVLAQDLLGRLTGDWHQEPVNLSKEAALALQRHPWPGNIRELRNVLERALLQVESSRIEVADLHLAGPNRGGLEEATSRMTLRELEKCHISKVLEEEGGHVDHSATRLGIPRSTLYQKLKVYGLARPSRS